MNIYVNCDIEEYQLHKLLDFACHISDTFSLARDYNGILSEEEITKFKESYLKYVKNQNHEMRERFNNDPNYHKRMCEFVGSEERAISYFDILLKQELSIVDHFNTEGKDTPYTTNREDFIKSEYTRTTTVTVGPLFEVIYFKIGKTLEEVRKQLPSLFSQPIYIDGVPYADLAFYQNENVKIAVCSHESYCYLKLSDEEVEEFKKLGIEYELN